MPLSHQGQTQTLIHHHIQNGKMIPSDHKTKENEILRLFQGNEYTKGNLW